MQPIDKGDSTRTKMFSLMFLMYTDSKYFKLIQGSVASTLFNQ